MTQFNLNYLFKDAISKYSQILRSWGLGPQQANFRESLLEFMGFAGGANDKEPTYQCRRHKRLMLIPGSGRSPGGGHGNPLQYSYLENPMDREA